MEVDDIHTHPCKFSRFDNGRSDSNKIGRKAGGEQYQDDDEDDGEVRGGGGGGRGGIGGGGGMETARLSSWSTGSRIYRVSRASGGKDRHSKVFTAKGLRDRRVRLSVATAIQFYDLQDRLGYDQPSKAVEWLIKASAEAIAELPSLSSTFPETPKPSDERRSSASQPRFELETEPSYQQQHHNMSLTKSGGSSPSETSKGSGLSLSRSEIRVKARERARERAAKEKEKEKEDADAVHQQNLNPSSQNASFTELLINGGANGASNNGNSPPESSHPGGSNFVLKTTRHLPTPPMDYFGAGIFAGGTASASRNSHASGFPAATHFGNHPPQPHTMTMQSPFVVAGDHHQELQQFSFMSDHLIPVATAAGSDYNLNFSISSGLNGFNRGTLQSNSPSPLSHVQRYSSAVDGPNLPFLIGTAASAAASGPVENHHFSSGAFDGRLQLYYADGCRQSDLKGKGKN